MEVLMIAPQPYFEPRGTPISVNQRLAALTSLGHKVDLATYHLGEDTPMKGLQIHRTPRLGLIRSVRIGPSPAKLILDVFLFLKSVGLLLRNRYDVIHTHEEACFMGLVLAPIFGCLHFYDMHSSLPRQLENFRYGNLGPIVKTFELLERFVLRKADAVITIGADLDEYVRHIHPEATIHRIENRPVLSPANGEIGGRIPEFGRSLKRQGWSVVVYTGSFERYQGLELLVDSIQEPSVASSRPFLILVGGTDDQVTELRRRAEWRGVANRCLLVGRVPIEKAFSYLDIADIVVSPRIDGTSIPLKIYSYMSAGKPILASDIPAHTQVLDESMAVLVDPTVHGLSAGLVRLLQDPALRKELAINSRRTAARLFGSAAYLGKVEALYRDGRQSSTVLSGAPSSVDE